ncbi:MAG: hypothetical protein WC330_00850 [Candidatus Omnitrophota bacterium]
MKQSILFLEDFTPLLINETKEIVSLDPAVSYELQKNNINYRILEDYYSEKELRANEETYFFEQLKWFDAFDDFLKENISCCKEYEISLAKANYLRLKYFVDTVIINSFVISNFLKKNQSLKELTYVHSPFPSGDKQSIFEFISTNRKVFSEILELFCKEKNIAFNRYIIEKKSSLPKKSILLHNAFAKRFLKKFLNLIKYKKIKKIFPANKLLNKTRILCMHAGSLDIDYPIEEFIKNKAHVYLKESGDIIREDIFFRRRVAILPDENHFLKILEKQCLDAAEKFQPNNRLIAWINDKCSLDVSSIVLPFLKYLISEDFFYILKDAQKMLNFYKHYKIDYVCARGNTDRDSQGTLVAAKYMTQKTKSICTQHANFAMDNQAFGVFETETYDYILTRDDIAESFFKQSLAKNSRANCEVKQSAHYLKNIDTENNLKNSPVRREKILYVEKKFFDRVRCFNNMIYPLGWYFEFQKCLIDFFGSETNFDFIYKHADAPGQAWAKNSILRYIEDKGYGNVTVSNERFINSLNLGDRIIVDFPSGAFFESAVANKPVLCICADYIKLIDEAKEIFGISLQSFSSTKEAVALIKKFIYANPKNFIVELPFSKDNFIDVFETILQENKNKNE